MKAADIKVDISVIIPTYNRATTIGATIESVLKQDYPHFEIVVVDDGSTDDTKKVINEYCTHKNGERLRYIKKENGGCASARNRGIQESKGKYVCFIDSDDLFEIGSLTTRMQAFKVYDVDYTVGNPRIVRSQSNPQGYVRKFNPEQIDVLIESSEDFYLCDAKKYRPNIVEFGVYGVLGGMTFSKDLLEQINKFDESLSHAEDVDLFIRTCFQVNQFVYIDRTLSAYNLFEQSSEGHKSQNIEKHFKSEKRRYIQLIKYLNQDLSDRQLARVAKRRICARRYKIRGIQYYRAGKSIKAIQSFYIAKRIYSKEKGVYPLMIKSLFPFKLRKALVK